MISGAVGHIQIPLRGFLRGSCEVPSQLLGSGEKDQFRQAVVMKRYGPASKKRAPAPPVGAHFRVQIRADVQRPARGARRAC